MWGSEVHETRYGKQVLYFDPIEHTYHLGTDPLKSVTQYIKEAGYYEPYGYNGEAAARFGTYVHEATALYDMDDLYMEGLDPLIRERVDGWIKFRKEFEPDLKWREKPVYHPIHMYAGTCDAAGLLDGLRVVIDIKTGSYHNWHRLQIAAYKMAIAAHDERYYDADCVLVYLQEGGKVRVIVTDDQQRASQLFLSILSTVNGKELYGQTSKSLNKRVKDA